MAFLSNSSRAFLYLSPVITSYINRVLYKTCIRRPHPNFLFKALCDFAALLKTSRHVPRSTFTAAEVSLPFGLSLKTYKCNPVMMFARRWLFHSRYSPVPKDYWPDRGGMYSKSSQLSSGNSISSKNDFTPPPPPPASRPRPSSLSRIAESDGERGKRFKPPRDFFRWKISGFLIQPTTQRVASVKLCTWLF